MVRSVSGAAVLMCLGMVLPVCAQGPGNVKVATVTASAKPTTVVRGGKGFLAITVAVSPQFHINAHKPNDPDLIPTTFTAGSVSGVTFGAAQFPAAKSIKVSYEKQPMLVYEGRATILIPFTIAKTAKPGRLAVSGTLGYQGCNNLSCYPPASAPVSAVVTVK
jgi:hypothetical protein